MFSHFSFNILGNFMQRVTRGVNRVEIVTNRVSDVLPLLFFLFFLCLVRFV